jgi:hypothetical protein
MRLSPNLYQEGLGSPSFGRRSYAPAVKDLSAV